MITRMLIGHDLEVGNPREDNLNFHLFDDNVASTSNRAKVTEFYKGEIRP